MDGSSQEDENSEVHKMDGSFQEDENSKVQKVDGYKLKFTNWMDHPKRMKILKPKKWTGLN